MPESREDKLRRLGINVSPEDLPDLILSRRALPANTQREMVITPEAPQGGVVRTVRTSSLDEMKRLIGLPDEQARRRRGGLATRIRLEDHRPAELLAALRGRRMVTEQQEVVSSLAREYVFGDSARVQEYRETIEEALTAGGNPVAITTVSFGRLRVRNGWRLVIPSSIQAFFAERIDLEPEATIVRRGAIDLNFNVGVMRVVQPELPLTWAIPG
jgi:hypothetical protein